MIITQECFTWRVVVWVYVIRWNLQECKRFFFLRVRVLQAVYFMTTVIKRMERVYCLTRETRMIRRTRWYLSLLRWHDAVLPSRWTLWGNWRCFGLVYEKKSCWVDEKFLYLWIQLVGCEGGGEIFVWLIRLQMTFFRFESVIDIFFVKFVT